MMFHAFTAKSDITLAWNPASGGNITNYMVYWGTASGVYLFGAPAGTQTSLNVTGLAPGAVYYFAVNAVANDGTESAYSNEVIYTNGAGSMMPPLPGGTNAGGTNFAGGGTGGSSGSGGSGGGAGSGFVSGTNTPGEISVMGVPPVLGLSFNASHHPVLNVTGVLGATFVLQSSSNASGQSAWNILTNLTMTNATGPTNQNSTSIVNLAFAPAAQTYEVVDTAPPTGEFFQVMMPYDYMVLAGANLSGQGYPSRLVLVRMPGVSADDVCYVAAQSSFLFFDATNGAFAVQSSQGTIRQIATTLSTSLGQNWTSASEFTYSNGVSSILATVVETEPSSSDPVVAAASAPSIQIDF